MTSRTSDSRSQQNTKHRDKKQQNETVSPKEADAGDSFTLVLTHNGALADGNKTIRATAEYIKDNHYQPGVPVCFKLEQPTDAKFTTDENPVNTDANGKAFKEFTDTKAQSGIVTAYLKDDSEVSDSKNFRFVGVDDWVVTLEIEDDFQVENTDPITAVATVTKGGVLKGSQNVHFQITGADSAKFSNGRQDIQAKTKTYGEEEGTVSVTITDTEKETGQVEAWIELDDGGKPNDTKPFEFVAPSIYSLHLDLAPEKGIAGSDAGVVATVTLTSHKEGYSVNNQKVEFQISHTSSATFVPGQSGEISENGQKYVDYTGPDGTVSAKLVDQKWETDTIDVKCKGLTTERQFQFNPPDGLNIVVYPLTTLSTDPSDPGKVVECSSCPADGHSKLTAKGLVKVNKDPWKNGGFVRCTFLPQSPKPGNARFIDGSIDSHVEIGPDGTFTVSFTDDHFEEKGFVRCQILVPEEHGPIASLAYTFVDPWTDVSSLSAAFTNNTTRATIYANGVNEAALTVAMTLSSYNDRKLYDYNSPSISQVEDDNTTKIVTYDPGGPLPSPWKISKTDNGFSQTLESARDQTPPAEDNGISDSVATITYYITNSGRVSGNDTAIGVTIQPTGQTIKPTGKQGTFHPEAAPIKAPIVKFTHGSDHILEAVPVVALIGEINYTDVSIKALRATPHKGEDDNNASADPGNYWRRYDFVISDLSGNGATAPIYKAELPPNVSFRADYSFAEVSDIIYNFKAYFWPNNVSNSQGSMLPTKSQYPVSSPGSGQQMVALAAEPNKLYATMFCAFGNVSVGTDKYYPVTLRLYDSYGNSGLFILNKDNTFPHSYADVPNWKPLVYTTDTNPQGHETSGTNSPVGFICQEPSDGAQGAWPWKEDNDYVTESVGGTPVELIGSSGFGYTVTPTQSGCTNDGQTYYITEKPGTYVTKNSKNAGSPGSGYVVKGDAFTWSFAPIWSKGLVVIAPDVKTSEPSLWKKVNQTAVHGSNRYSYWIVVSEPAPLVGVGSGQALFQWKMK